MVEARAKAPFISILSFFWGEEKSFLVLSFLLFIFLSILILLSSLLSLLEL